jgi:DNA-binding transcriptional LysR family regulator
MNLSDLRTFMAVVDCGSVVKAAVRVHRVQSNVTARIQHLEQDLGKQLFERTGRRMILTPEGRLLFNSAAELLTMADRIRTQLDGTDVVGVMRIGSMEGTAATRLPPLLARFGLAYPAASIELSTGTAGALKTRLAAGELDIVFAAGDPMKQQFDASIAFEETLVLVQPPVSAKQNLVDSVDLVTFPSGCAYRACAEQWAHDSGLNVSKVTELASYHAILACVSANMGHAVVPKALLDIYPQRDLLSYKSLPRAIARQPTWMLHRKNAKSPSLQAFSASIKLHKLMTKNLA